MQTTTHTWGHNSETPHNATHTKSVETTVFRLNGQWVSGETLREQLGDKAANRIIELHRRIRETAMLAMRLHREAIERMTRHDRERPAQQAAPGW